MELPFTVEQFIEVFRTYNTSVWPMQIVLNLFAAVAIVLALRGGAARDRLVGVLLGVLWLWTGLVYHIGFFSGVNPAAYLFGGLTALEGVLLLWLVAGRARLSFAWRNDLSSWIGALFILYALLIYPVLGHQLGHRYPGNPTFGAPCPTTIFTFGLLLWARGRVLLPLAIVPFLWSLIGGSAAFKLGVREDYGLIIAGIVGLVLIFLNRKKTLESHPTEQQHSPAA